MQVEFCYDSGRTPFQKYYLEYVPCVGDHIVINNLEWIVTGRLFDTCGEQKIKVFIRKATSNDITFMS